MYYKKFSNLKLSSVGLGMGDYYWDESHIKYIQYGIELGINFIDTAESYGGGTSEKIIGKAINGTRDNLIISTKFSAENNTYDGVLKSIDGSLKRMNIDYIDLYQLHWPNPKIPIQDTLSALEHLVDIGKIKYIGIGNMLMDDINEVDKSLKKYSLSSIQLEYSLFDRLVEEDILPYCKKNDKFLIAYSPLDRGRLVNTQQQLNTITDIANKYSKTPSQIVMNWLVNNKPVVVIPKSTNINHLKDNVDSVNFKMDDEDYEKIKNKCFVKKEFISVNDINVSSNGQDGRNVYTTLEQAVKNKLNYIPSSITLSEYINDNIKPVRLVKNKNRYDLVEGRIRYWAWVLKFGNKKPIPSYIRNNF